LSYNGSDGWINGVGLTGVNSGAVGEVIGLGVHPAEMSIHIMSHLRSLNIPKFSNDYKAAKRF